MRFSRGDKGMGDFMAALDDWRELDFMVLHYSIDSLPGNIREWAIATGAGPAIMAARGHRLPSATVIHFIANEESWVPSLKLQQICIEAGFPLFLSMRGAAKAIRRLMDFDRAHPGMLAAVRQEGG